MTRIVAGAARGRRLAVPPAGTRPTADRAREGLFSSLAASVGGPVGGGMELTGLRFLDLYAGSGAVGLEALSRGAVHVALVERDRAAADVVTKNVAAVGLPGASCTGRPSSSGCAAQRPPHPFDLVFADPPYDLGDGDLDRVLRVTHRAGLARPRRRRRGGAGEPARPGRGPTGFTADRDRRYGEATLWYGRAAG